MIAFRIIRWSVRLLAMVWLCPDCNRPRPYCNGGCGEGR